MKINIDGLLGLNLEEIEIVYRRCRGEKVENIAKAMDIGQSTIFNDRNPRILEMLEVEKWRDVDDELSVPLRKIIPTVSALKEGWPEAFREKLEALKEPLNSATQTSTVTDSPTSSVPSESNRDPGTNIPSNAQSDESQRKIGDGSIRPTRWPFIAVPLLILCLLCVSGGVFFSRFIPFLQPTQSPQAQVPSSTQALLATSTLPVIVSETASPTLTFTDLPPSATSAPTDTPLPTTSPTSSVPPLFFDDFTNGKSDQWQIVYGDDPPIVNNALNFTSTTLMVIDANEWTDYRVSFDVANMQCQVGVRSSGVTVGLHYQNANNMTALRIAYWGDHCEAVWYTIKNGEWEQIPNSNFPLPPKDSNGVRHWVIDVQGNTYGTPFGPSIVIENFPTGGVSLLVDTGVTIDNFIVSPLIP